VSLASLISKPCQIIRRLPGTTTDEYGRDIPNEVIVDTVCEIQKMPRRTEGEAPAEDELSDTLWHLFLPSGTEIRTGDAVIFEGWRYEMVGDPWDARTGSPRVWHVEATLRRTAATGDED